MHLRAERQMETLATSVLIMKQIEIYNAFSQIWLPLTLTFPFFIAIYLSNYIHVNILLRWNTPMQVQ